jgi:hypothetical protein
MALCEKCREREAMTPERQRYLETHHRGWHGSYKEHTEAAKKGWITIRANKLKRKREEKEAIENAKRLARRK